MKTLFVRIKENTSPWAFDETAYRFPTHQDEAMFNEIFADIRSVITSDFRGKVSYQYHFAWHALEKLGWVHDNSEDKGGVYYLRWVLPENKVEKLELMLKHHDWTYMMSDDYRWYSAGSEHEKKIKALMAEVGEPAAQELWDKYAR